MASATIRQQAISRRAPGVNARQHAEVGQQLLDLAQQGPVDRAQPHRAGVGARLGVDRAVGLEQAAQIAAHAVLAALPDDLGHLQLGLAGEAQRAQPARQQRRADRHALALRHRDRRDLMEPPPLLHRAEHPVDEGGHRVRQRPLLVPERDDRRLLAMATVREMPVTGHQAEQAAQFLRALPAELALAGLDQQLVAHLQLGELQAPAGGVEVMPGGGGDLVALAGDDPEHWRLRCRHEGRNGRAHLGATRLLVEHPAVDRHLQVDAALMQLADRDQSVLGGQPGLADDTRIGRRDRLAIAEIVVLVDAIDEQDARLGMVVGRAHDLVPQLARANPAIDPLAVVAAPGAGGLDLAARLGLVDQLDVVVGLDRAHELVRDADRDVEVAQVALVLGVDELLDVGMVAAQHAHLRAAPAAGRLDRLAAAVEHPHVAHRPGGVAVGRADPGALRPDAREVVADAAAATHGLGRLGQRGVDAGKTLFRLGDRVAHRLHEAVDQRRAQRRARRRGDASGRHEAALLRLDEAGLPVGARFRRLAGRQRTCDAPAHLGGAAFAALGVLLDQHLGADRLRGQRGLVPGPLVPAHIRRHSAFSWPHRPLSPRSHRLCAGRAVRARAIPCAPHQLVVNNLTNLK